VWVKDIETTIRKNLHNTGKGWFNLEESDKESYEFSKLKKFLTIVKFMMQDAVLNLAKHSLRK